MPEPPANYLEFLNSTQLLRTLDAGSRRKFISFLEISSLSPGGNLISQGEKIGYLSIICSGSLAMTALGLEDETRFVTTLEPGETIGGWMLCTDDDRSYADIRALQASDIARISRHNFLDFFREFPAEGTRILELLASHERRLHLLLALHSSQLFGDLDELALRELQSELEVSTVRGGDILCRQGDSGDSLYLVVSGRLRVTVAKPEQNEMIVGELGRGEIVGEMAVISGEPRTGTVYAIRDTQVACLPREGFQRLMYRHPDTVFSVVTKKVVKRLRDELSRTEPVVESISTIAVVPNSPEVPLDSFCSSLADALRHHGSTTHLSSGRMDALLGNAGVSQVSEDSQQNLRLVDWLGKLETEQRFVIYQSDPTPSEWTKRCLRQADRVLIVGNAAGSFSLGVIEEEQLSQYHPITSARRLLVLLHPDSSREPSGTRVWLTHRRIDRHFHVRTDRKEDIARLARHLIGQATGLALGGGFARGMVHIGVIRALLELGIPIDAIGGNSMGALIAAEYSLGWDLKKMLRDTATGCAACIRGMTFPLVAFKTGAEFSNLVRRFVGDRQIEDLWLPYFCISANLNRAELKVHTEGSLAKAILASSRVPGVFPPVVYDGEMHVDGGVLNNVPVDVMRSLTHSGVVIGVDAVPSRQFDLIDDYGLELSGWRVALRRWNPFSRKKSNLPHILLIMLRTIEFGGVSYKRSNAQFADLYLAPPLRDYKPTDFTYADSIVEIGYQCAMEKAKEWLNNDLRRKLGKKSATVRNALGATD